MVTKDEFWSIMGAYGSQIWPAQIMFYLVAVALVVWLLYKPGRLPGILAKSFLAIAFAWNGILFYLTLARGMAGRSRGNYFTGALFILAALLFAVDLFRQKMQFRLPAVRWQKFTTFLLMALVFCYPVFGALSGHGYTSLIVPGTHPCPTTALGLLLLTLALPQVDKVIYILLVFFAVPFTPFLQIAKYGVLEDTILLAVGVYGLVLLVKHWRPQAG